MSTAYRARFEWQRSFVKQQKSAGCSAVGCKERRIAALELHHLDPSLKVADVTSRYWLRFPDAEDRLACEAAKCIVVCTMHHRELTFRHARTSLREWTAPRKRLFYHRRKELIKQFKLAKQYCHACNLEIDDLNHELFDLDHLDPSKKRGKSIAGSWCVKESDLITEMRKCRLVCANCHRCKSI